MAGVDHSNEPEQSGENPTNREKNREHPAMDDETELGNGSAKEHSSPHVKPFRFKDSVDAKQTYKSSRSSHHHRRRRRHRDRSSSPYRSSRDARRARYSDDHRRHHNSRHSRSRSRSPRPRSRELSPDTAFRESVFDAMADDEGAAYWEGVYGQPIHNFGPMPPRSGEKYEGDDYNDPGVLDADAYAAYVRRKMWERSHQHIVEERKRREEEQMRRQDQIRQERAEARRRQEQERQARGGRDAWDEDQGWRRNGTSTMDDDDFASKIDESLRRGAQRKEEKCWREAWERYSSAWTKSTAADQISVPELPWPVRSGREADVNGESVREFFDQGFTVGRKSSNSMPPVDIKTQLKVERVRWHPDKVMQRFNTAVSEDTIKTVTAVFQTVDQMWNERKGQ